jgi:XTP/dITP diphosphohydrolase
VSDGVTVPLVLASRNAHKVAELRRILADADLDFELLTVADFADVPDVVESGVTFAENALLKARAVSIATGVAAVADDSGFRLDVLGGMPGVFSARWSGRHGDDRANLELVLAQVADVPDEHLGASFVSAAALVRPDGDEVVVEGVWPGRMTRVPRGSNGFGYDPIFVPEGGTRTSAELSDVEKDVASHRGRALRALLPALRELSRRPG